MSYKNIYLNVKHLLKYRIFVNSSQIRYSCTDVQTTPESESPQKLVKVAIVGVPNAGKSTFINNLIDHRVSNRINVELIRKH